MPHNLLKGVKNYKIKWLFFAQYVRCHIHVIFFCFCITNVVRIDLHTYITHVNRSETDCTMSFVCGLPLMFYMRVWFYATAMLRMTGCCFINHTSWALPEGFCDYSGQTWNMKRVCCLFWILKKREIFLLECRAFIVFN